MLKSQNKKQISSIKVILIKVSDPHKGEFQHLIDANNETRELLLPKLMKSIRKDEFTNHPKVVFARAKLDEA